MTRERHRQRELRWLLWPPDASRPQPRYSVGCHGSLLREPPATSNTFFSFNQMLSGEDILLLSDEFFHRPRLPYLFLDGPPPSSALGLTSLWSTHWHPATAAMPAVRGGHCEWLSNLYLYFCETLNVCVPSKFRYWNLNPSVMVLGGGALRRRLAHEGGALTMGCVSL